MSGDIRFVMINAMKTTTIEQGEDHQHRGESSSVGVGPACSKEPPGCATSPGAADARCCGG